MKAFLTMWDEDKEMRKSHIVDCPTLTVNDGVQVDIDGEWFQLFNVDLGDKIYKHVATIEII